MEIWILTTISGRSGSDFSKQLWRGVNTRRSQSSGTWARIGQQLKQQGVHFIIIICHGLPGKVYGCWVWITYNNLTLETKMCYQDPMEKLEWVNYRLILKDVRRQKLLTKKSYVSNCYFLYTGVLGWFRFDPKTLKEAIGHQVANSPQPPKLAGLLGGPDTIGDQSRTMLQHLVSMPTWRCQQRQWFLWALQLKAIDPRSTSIRVALT